MEEMLKAVSTVGFPIAVACYMLWDKSQTQAKMIEAQQQHTTVLSELKLLIQTLVK